MYSCSIDRRWDVWRPHPGQGPADALANWASKTRAVVEWAPTVTRRPDNTVVHIVTPKLTCTKCHPLMDNRGATLSYPYSDPSRAALLTESVIDDWRRKYHGHYELIAYSYSVGGYGLSAVFSIIVYYKLKQVLIQDCEGQGSSLKEAKSMASRRLLESGHCMVCL
ncbi:unnamed protein product [Rhizoctonia solani]|uniref:Uncharacterized protein n=1 Tax=Rhizoctonia solani TaxID=456999 RepID=A0A8H3HYS7_9AGAM|nr:unnamed protein product [Rhizoctonia solani]